MSHDRVDPPADFDPCGCPDPNCRFKEPPNRADDQDSPTLAELRERIRADCESRRRLGPLGRQL
ncbi:hypothetical protein [Streptomyces sp. x-80]|jgi:hypothetical protein|uniref:hypothetical protein n=1 Tax=Streptomyces sp. x-80 TaxID=2789282 RepID=UPI00397F5AE5